MSRMYGRSTARHIGRIGDARCPLKACCRRRALQAMSGHNAQQNEGRTVESLRTAQRNASKGQTCLPSPPLRPLRGCWPFAPFRTITLRKDVLPSLGGEGAAVATPGLLAAHRDARRDVLAVAARLVMVCSAGFPSPLSVRFRPWGLDPFRQCVSKGTPCTPSGFEALCIELLKTLLLNCGNRQPFPTVSKSKRS